MEDNSFNELIHSAVEMKEHIAQEDRIRMMHKALQIACDVLRTGSTDMPVDVVRYNRLEDYFIDKARKYNIK